MTFANQYSNFAAPSIIYSSIDAFEYLKAYKRPSLTETSYTLCSITLSDIILGCRVEWMTETHLGCKITFRITFSSPSKLQYKKWKYKL